MILTITAWEKHAYHSLSDAVSISIVHTVWPLKSTCWLDKNSMPHTISCCLFPISKLQRMEKYTSPLPFLYKMRFLNISESAPSQPMFLLNWSTGGLRTCTAFKCGLNNQEWVFCLTCKISSSGWPARQVEAAIQTDTAESPGLGSSNAILSRKPGLLKTEWEQDGSWPRIGCACFIYILAEGETISPSWFCF